MGVWQWEAQRVAGVSMACGSVACVARLACVWVCGVAWVCAVCGVRDGVGVA
jgi:hypothetical protein